MIPTMIALAVAAAPVAQPAAAQADVMAAMTASAEGWNAGDLDRFVAIYASDATFVGRDGLVQGRPAIAARYRPSFTGTGNARGRLSFQGLAFRTLSKVHAILWARWTLAKEDGAKPETGMTTLVFEHRADGWRIISDHSS